MKTDTVTVGALLRRNFRTQLDVLRARKVLTYTEHKGPLDSRFVITAGPREWARIIEYSKQINGNHST